MDLDTVATWSEDRRKWMVAGGGMGCTKWKQAGGEVGEAEVNVDCSKRVNSAEMYADGARGRWPKLLVEVVW